MASPYSGCFGKGSGGIEIAIGIEIENLHNDPMLAEYGKRLGNLKPATFNQKRETGNKKLSHEWG